MQSTPRKIRTGRENAVRETRCVLIANSHLHKSSCVDMQILNPHQTNKQKKTVLGIVLTKTYVYDFHKSELIWLQKYSNKNVRSCIILFYPHYSSEVQQITVTITIVSFSFESLLSCCIPCHSKHACCCLTILRQYLLSLLLHHSSVWGDAESNNSSLPSTMKPY